MAIARSCHYREPGLVEEFFILFLIGIIEDGGTATVAELLSLYRSGEKGAHFGAERQLHAAAVVVWIEAVSQFYGSFQEGGGQLVFLEVVGIANILKPHGRCIVFDAHIGFIEVHGVGRNTGAEGYTEMPVCFEWKVQHQVDVEAAGQTFCSYRIGLLGPVEIAEL